jgi:tetratricopeptide (TPR) repeat protein
VISLAYFGYVLAPVASSVDKIQRANRAISAGQFEYAHQLLGQAAEADPLSATAPAFNGRLYLHRSGLLPRGDRDLLLATSEHLKTATERNDASFKNFERLTDVYGSLAEISKGSERTDWLDKASDAASHAIKRYPGSGRLHFKLARIAEQSDEVEVAIEHYRKAMEIEEEYRDQFRRIYPERKEVVSRLGKEKYAEAAQRIEMLSAQRTP